MDGMGLDGTQDKIYPKPLAHRLIHRQMVVKEFMIFGKMPPISTFIRNKTQDIDVQQVSPINPTPSKKVSPTGVFTCIPGRIPVLKPSDFHQSHSNHGVEIA